MRITRSLLLPALLVAALLAPLPARAAEPGLAPTTPGVAAGDVIIFAATGFAPRERIAVWATAPDGTVLGGDDVSTDGGGQARIAFRVPAGAVGGTWALTAFGTTSRAQAVARFEVAGHPAANAASQAWAAPESGPAGSTFRFAATGFERRERVSYWFTAPDGAVFAAFSQQIAADTGGRVDISWPSPADAPRGAWVVTIQGVRSGVARAVSFRVE